MTGADFDQRLAAILAADAAGYSRLMSLDERATVVALDSARAAFRRHIESHRGRVIDTAGDSVLARFDTAAGAVSAALAVQHELATLGEDMPDDRCLRFRVGLHLGDVIVKSDGTIYGDGVNIAARLQVLADPGQVIVSDAIHGAVRGKVSASFTDLGEQRVKNIAYPVRAYAVTPHDACATEANSIDAAVGQAENAHAATETPSIAVLPFTNLSSDAEQEFFADGLTEEIISMLAAWRAFPVIARNSTFIYKNKAVDARQVARELGVRYIVEGSVRRGGQKIRVAAQLIDAANGHHLLASHYDRDVADLFSIQEEIAVSIAATVEPELERLEILKSSTKRTGNIAAWECCVRGNSLLNAYTPVENAKARGMFEKAITLDASYSDAHAGLAFTYLRELLLEVADTREESVARGLDAARRAVALDGSSSLAHLALGTAYIWANKHDLSIEETRIAIQLNPSNFHACLALGNRLDLAGHSGEGLAMMERALKLNPRDPRTHVYYCYLARALVNAKRYEEALQWAHSAVRVKPDFPQSHFLLALCMSHLGRCDEARIAAADCDQINPGFVQKRRHWNAYRDQQANTHLLAGLRKCGILPKTSTEK